MSVLEMPEGLRQEAPEATPNQADTPSVAEGTVSDLGCYRQLSSEGRRVYRVIQARNGSLLTYERIAAEAHVSRSTARRSAAKIEEAGLLVRIKAVGENGLAGYFYLLNTRDDYELPDSSERVNTREKQRDCKPEHLASVYTSSKDVEDISLVRIPNGEDERSYELASRRSASSIGVHVPIAARMSEATNYVTGQREAVPW